MTSAAESVPIGPDDSDRTRRLADAYVTLAELLDEATSVNWHVISAAKSLVHVAFLESRPAVRRSPGFLDQG